MKTLPQLLQNVTTNPPGTQMFPPTRVLQRQVPLTALANSFSLGTKWWLLLQVSWLCTAWWEWERSGFPSFVNCMCVWWQHTFHSYLCLLSELFRGRGNRGKVLRGTAFAAIYLALQGGSRNMTRRTRTHMPERFLLRLSFILACQPSAGNRKSVAVCEGWWILRSCAY